MDLPFHRLLGSPSILDVTFSQKRKLKLEEYTLQNNFHQLKNYKRRNEDEKDAIPLHFHKYIFLSIYKVRVILRKTAFPHSKLCNKIFVYIYKLLKLSKFFKRTSHNLQIFQNNQKCFAHHKFTNQTE